jgi:hypothetical protein
LDASIRVIDDTFRLSKCVQIARLYLEVLALFFKYNLLIEMILRNIGALGHYWTLFVENGNTRSDYRVCVFLSWRLQRESSSQRTTDIL